MACIISHLLHPSEGCSPKKAIYKMKVFLLAVLAFVAVSAEESQVLKNFHIGQTQFTVNVYKELLKSNSGNFLVCPISVDIILALLHEGAKGKTAQQISQGLHLPENNNEIQQIIRELIPHLKGNDEFSLSSANKVYLKNGLEINDQYKKTAVEVYGAEIENIDFAKTEQAAKEINKWVEGKTHEKIQNLIAAKDLDASVRAILVNALYFQGKWVHPFNARSSAKKDFHVNKKDKIQVDMMQQTSTFNYYENAELKAKFLEMSYQGHEVTLTIVLPNDVEGLSTLEERLADVLTPPTYVSEKVHVIVPKFKTETKIEFKPVLQALGIEDVFEDSADLTGITAEKASMKVTKVIQKAFIEVDEEGTTAAAATAVIANLGSAPRPHQIKEFFADHPFIYYLRSPAGILFVGRYINN